jgi:hypothetical protein
MTTTEPPLLPPLPFEDLHCADFPGYFNDQNIQRVHRYLDEIQFASLREQMDVSANTLHNSMQIQTTDAELSILFGHSGGWAQGTIARDVHSANSEKLTARWCPKAIDSDKEKKLIQFCSVRQSEKNLVTVQDAIDFRHDNRVQVDKFWVRRFVERNSETLALQHARLLKKERHEISEDDLNRYFDAVTIQL